MPHKTTEYVSLEELADELHPRLNELGNAVESPYLNASLSVGQFTELDLYLKTRTKPLLKSIAHILTKTTILGVIIELIRLATR